jgi:hypothetical protein
MRHSCGFLVGVNLKLRGQFGQCLVLAQRR